MSYNQQPYFNNGYYPQYQNGAVPDALNQYKGPYQQMPMQQPIQQPIQQIPVPVTKANSDMIWIQGEAGAKGYLVAPGNTVVLWDTESPTIYVKSADASGVPSMRILDFKERASPHAPENVPQTHECKCGSKFVPREDFESKYQEILSKISDIEDKYNSLTTKPKTTKKGDAENE